MRHLLERMRSLCPERIADWCRLRDSNPRPPDYKATGAASSSSAKTVRQSAQSRNKARLAATVRDKKSLVLKALMRQSPDRSATVLSVETRAEGCSDVEFRRISLQAIAPGVSTTCPQNPMRGKFTHSYTYICALKPGASICDISDPGVPGLVLRVAISGSKAWLFRFKWDGTPTRITLGKFPSVGLAEARQLALKNREWLDRGIDPRRAVDRVGKRNSDERTTSPAKSDPLAPGQEPPDPSDFETRLAATPKDRVPRPDPGATGRASSSSRTNTSRSGSKHKARRRRAGCFELTCCRSGIGAMEGPSLLARSLSFSTRSSSAVLR
jgi:Arm DNA-binding domain